MTLLLIVAIAAIGFTFVCAWADSRPPIDPDDPFDQPRHVRVIDDQEPTA